MNCTRAIRSGLNALLLSLVLWSGIPTIVQAADCVWTGQQSTAFFEAGNWSDCNGSTGTEPPEADDSVTIQNVNNDPVITVNTTIATLILRANGLLQVDTDAVLTVGNFNWQGGVLRGEGRTVANEMSLSTTASKTLNGHTLDNAGTATWLDGNISLADGATLNNLDGALFDIHTNNSMSAGAGENPVAFNNAGTARKSDGNTNQVLVPFHNTGTVEALLPTQFNGGGTNSGIFDIGENGTIQLSGIHTIEPPAVVTGTG
ncbi:MAG: hypothetical protein AAF639_39400, partial [Chloroflexota bacterium]